MSIVALHADARADVCVRARPDLLERRLARFRPRFRSRVRTLAAQHPRLEDLASSFPALLFALAVPRRGYDREHVCARVIAGAPLRELSRLTQLPLWLRRVPPEAFDRPIPALPCSSFASGQIANHLPRSHKDIGAWLTAIGNAWGYADEAVAVWMARAWRRPPKRRHNYARHVQWMCVWAWYARHVADDPCKIRCAWTPHLSLDAALRLSGEWRMNIELYAKLGGGPIADVWLKPGRIGPFDIVPLQTFEDVRDEALAMRHCIRWYGQELAENWCRLWSIRCGEQRIATFEISQVSESPFLHIGQLKLADDKRAAAGIWAIAHRWLREQDELHAGVSDAPENAPIACVKAWRRLWRPYWLAKRCFPQWLPLTPTRRVLDSL